MFVALRLQEGGGGGELSLWVNRNKAITASVYSQTPTRLLSQDVNYSKALRRVHRV